MCVKELRHRCFVAVGSRLARAQVCIATAINETQILILVGLWNLSGQSIGLCFCGASRYLISSYYSGTVIEYFSSHDPRMH